MSSQAFETVGIVGFEYRRRGGLVVAQHTEVWPDPTGVGEKLRGVPFGVAARDRLRRARDRGMRRLDSDRRRRMMGVSPRMRKTDGDP